MDSPYISRIQAATDLLLDDIEELDDAAMAGATLLPGWDRAMLLTHLSANADGTRRAVEAASRGEVAEVYHGGAQGRQSEIEAGRGAKAAELRQRLIAAAGALQSALQAAPDEVWQARAIGHRGEVQIGPDLVVARLREVEVHHVDLRTGYGPSDWPTAWVMEEMDRSMLDLPGRLPEGLAVVLEATDLGQRWVAGNGDETDISGTLAELFSWLTGRAPGVPGQDSPPLGPWR